MSMRSITSSKNVSSTLLYVMLFFFNDPATTAIYTLSLHDALPILEEIIVHCSQCSPSTLGTHSSAFMATAIRSPACLDRKSTRLNSSHSQISYAVFCLKKKKTQSASGSKCEVQRRRRFLLN